MATKKAAAKPPAETPKAAPKPEEAPAQPVSNDIDSRMARLLEDHRRMGARP